LEEQRAVLAFLYSTPAYRRTLDLFGWTDVGEALQRATREGAWSRLAELLTDDMMTTLLPMGTWSVLPGILSEWYRGLTQAILVQPPAPGRDDEFMAMIADIRRIT
ncbi:MAG: LLM class F420-dependent oxidoreductase, partial [Actinomycetota bacterium]